jgi:hypothetical protein
VSVDAEWEEIIMQSPVLPFAGLSSVSSSNHRHQGDSLPYALNNRPDDRIRSLTPFHAAALEPSKLRWSQTKYFLQPSQRFSPCVTKGRATACRRAIKHLALIFSKRVRQCAKSSHLGDVSEAARNNIRHICTESLSRCARFGDVALYPNV